MNPKWLCAGSIAALLAGCVDVEMDRLLRNERSAKDRIEELGEDIARLETDIKALEPDASRAGKADAGIKQAIESKRAAQENAEEVESSLSAGIALLEAYRNEFRTINTLSEVRAKEGDELGDFQLKTGKSIRSGVVSAVNGNQIGVKHSAGVAYIPVADLPPPIYQKVVWQTETAKGIKIPESNPRPIEDLKAVLARRPDSLKTAQQRSRDRLLAGDAKRKKESEDYQRKQAEQDARYEAEKEARRLRMEADVRQRAAEAAERTRQMQIEDAKRRELEAARATIDAQIDKLEAAIDFQRSAKSNQRLAWSNSSIKVSAQDQSRIMGQYDAKIRQLEDQVRALVAQRNQIR